MLNSKMKVISSDEQEFKIDYDLAKQSKLLKLYFDGNDLYNFHIILSVLYNRRHR
jgi:hypothetical protein